MPTNDTLLKKRHRSGVGEKAKSATIEPTQATKDPVATKENGIKQKQPKRTKVVVEEEERHSIVGASTSTEGTSTERGKKKRKMQDIEASPKLPTKKAGEGPDADGGRKKQKTKLADASESDALSVVATTEVKSSEGKKKRREELASESRRNKESKAKDRAKSANKGDYASSTASVIKAEIPKVGAQKSTLKAPPSSEHSSMSRVVVSAINPSASPSKKSKRATQPRHSSPAPETTSNDETDGKNENEDQDEVHLFGFSTDDEDSSDDDLGVDDIPGIDVGSLPTIARDDATVKSRLDKAKRQPAVDRGVIYLGRIPHGFYEDQMRAYFSQFGDVTRLRLSRNKKTGRSKHYGFVEFDSEAVARIVAETMSNYLIMGHILQCRLIPKDEVHPSLWVGANKKWRKVPHHRVVRVKHNRPRTEEERRATEGRLLKRQEARKRKLAEAGIEYDFDTVAYKKHSAPEAK